MAKQNLTSPSAVLKKLMEDYGLNPSKLGAAINLNQGTLRLILLGKGKISCSVALKLAKFFGNTPEYWLNLQNRYDIAEAAKDKELTAILKSIKKATKAPPAKKKAAAKKDDPKTKKGGKTVADAKKPAKAAAGKVSAAKKPVTDSKKNAKTADKAPAVKRSIVKKPAAGKKAAETKPAGAKRGRKPKSEVAPPAPEPDPVFDPGSVFTPEYGAGYDPAPVYQEETPVLNQEPEDDSGFSLTDADESWES
jgi:addiction module HigA family antidote